MATEIGIAYVYLAYSTRRLKRLVADKPPLQPFTASMDGWCKDAAIAGLCFLVAFGLLWRMLGEHGGINLLAAIQVVTGAVLVMGGMAVLRIKTGYVPILPNRNPWQTLSSATFCPALRFCTVLHAWGQAFTSF